MPPKRKSKALAEVSTPKAAATPAQDEDAMDVDNPKASETPRAADTPTTNNKPNVPTDDELLADLWSEDQTSSLFKAISRWKPSGMHKNFRMLAISEHLRNHGFDPDLEMHTRVPGIWNKLGQFFDMDMINERDNAFDYVNALGGDEEPEAIYSDWELPLPEFHEAKWTRAAATEEHPDISWTNSDADNQSAPAKKPVGKGKRKRAETTTADGSSVAGSTTSKKSKTRRSSTVEDTDRETPAAASPVGRSARGARSKTRAAAKAKTESVDDSTHDDSDEGEEEDDDEENEDGEGSDDSDDTEEEEEEEEAEAPATRSGRGSNLRGRGRGRGRGKGRKRG